VIPRQEINSKERDKFWEKEEQEEKERQAEEMRRRVEERNKLENEQKQREVNKMSLFEIYVVVIFIVCCNTVYSDYPCTEYLQQQLTLNDNSNSNSMALSPRANYTD
jgi:hypothetical protein